MTTKRERNPAAKRARIAAAALDLFERQGYAETTIDQIAEAAQVGRRTVFEYFPTKAAMVFDHLVVQREATLQRLRERPLEEPPLVSLHAVLRELGKEGYDRRLLGQIRAVLNAEPELGLEALGTERFERELIEVMNDRGAAAGHSVAEIHAVTNMAVGWFLTAVRLFFRDGRRSLVRCYDDVVGSCLQATSDL